ncbi:exodeoxyribonuclease VII small subunit [Orbus hercynius]|uniref:Exodeoxyribonuclease 7 small subunit n=1 Tax=Orbus hercynius TaxID=593135 RepID=A0A495RCJ4_9GAMM|nr:exodeoxyribonuclease VII small subunit [Orbus hercynius]RKS85197.1 exodeoxyribonuclease VII small subunit [Orbus hercynius]
MAKAQEKSQSFEQTLKELENIVSKLEVGNLPLDDALTEFEKGVKLAKQGQTQLQKAEQRIQILLSESSDAQLQNFNAENES